MKARIGQWLLASTGAVAGLAVLAVHAPNRIKLLGLFAVAIGFLEGYGIGQFAQHGRVPSRRLVGLAAFAIIVAGQIGATWEAHRLYDRTLREQYRADPTALFAGRVGFEPGSAMAEILQETRRERAERLDRLTSLSAYLKHRVSAVGSWSQPWPAVLWGAEILIAGAAGTWIALRQLPAAFCRTCESWREAQRSVLVDGPTAERVLEILEIDPGDPLSPACRMNVSFIACRCPDAAPEIECVLESPSVKPLGTAHPDPETRTRLGNLLDGVRPLG